jgi:heme/copper-type cytochrome/quinol oxidase subunit 3
MLKKSWMLMTGRPELYRSKLVFHLFLLSLAVFFTAGMLVYLALRVSAFRRGDTIPYVQLRIPLSFWISTAVLLVVSFSLHHAVTAIHINHMRAFARWLWLAAICAVTFTIIQAFGLRQLLDVHLSATDGSTKAYGICFTMAFLHALHVVGGLIFLGYVIRQALRGRYDHERHWAVDNCASYWHFLDVVWIIMLLTFYVAR